MMNSRINKILNSYNVEAICENADIALEWDARASKENDFLFYNLIERDIDYEKVFKHIEKSKYRLLFFNKIDSRLSQIKNSFCLDQLAFYALQEDLCDVVYPFSKKVFMGVTGTNGKTTTVDLARQILNQAGHRCLTIGTMGVQLDEVLVKSNSFTTPPYILFRKYIHEYDSKCDFLVMEISSHALHQKRIYSKIFDCVGWTNFTQDHLDYHKSMENYFLSKKSIADQCLKEGRKCFIPYGQDELHKKLSMDKRFILCDRPDDLESLKLNSKLLSSFNRQNFNLAKSMVEAVISLDGISYEKLKLPKGRFEVVEGGDKRVVVDYAHTPDALLNICKQAKAFFNNCDIHLVFGCGGDRDKTKRPLMAKSAQKYCKKVYLTNDNPRREDPQQIVNDIIVGFDQAIYEVILDREECIKKAIVNLNSNQILIVAGKGHECYQILGNEKFAFDDVKIVKKYLQ